MTVPIACSIYFFNSNDEVLIDYYYGHPFYTNYIALSIDWMDLIADARHVFSPISNELWSLYSSTVYSERKQIKFAFIFVDFLSLSLSLLVQTELDKTVVLVLGAAIRKRVLRQPDFIQKLNRNILIRISHTTKMKTKTSMTMSPLNVTRIDYDFLYLSTNDNDDHSSVSQWSRYVFTGISQIYLIQLQP